MKYLATLCVLLLVACTQAPQQAIEDTTQTVQAQETAKPEPVVIVALGDSLTAGTGVLENDSYPAQLERLLRAKGYDVYVINKGVSGETSSGALNRINDVRAEKPDMVILETGVNDILRGVPTNTTRTNIETMIRQLQDENITVILAGMEAYGTFQGYNFEVRTMYPSIAEEYNTPFIPFFLAGVAGNQQLNLPDYVHPNAQGYAVIAEHNVLPVVEAHLN